MGLKRASEFRQDAVRIVLTSGLPRKQVADDLGIRQATLDKWITAHRDTDVVSKNTEAVFRPNAFARCRCQFARTKGLPRTSSLAQAAI